MDTIKQIFLAVTGVLLTVIIFCCILYTFRINNLALPQPPVLTNSTETTVQEAKSKEIANYQTLAREFTKQKTDAFDLAVTKTLQPILNTLLTGVFTYIIARMGINAIKGFLAAKQSSCNNKS